MKNRLTVSKKKQFVFYAILGSQIKNQEMSKIGGSFSGIKEI